jgi:hypothetical protein
MVFVKTNQVFKNRTMRNDPMKISMVFTALLTLLCASPYAADTSSQPPTTTVTTTPTTTAVTKTTEAPATATTTTTSTTPDGTVTTQSTTVQQSKPVIDCQYHIPASNKQIEQSLVTNWSENAAVQAFNFTPIAMDDQLTKLKNCFTDQGWQGFNDALQKSGNVNAIKTQNLTVSSQVDGTTQISMIKENQWKITVPVQVVYQNEKEKLTQLLSVDLLVGRKVSGDLGIMQMIATPRTPVGAATTAGSTPTATTTVTTPAAAPATSTVTTPITVEQVPTSTTTISTTPAKP